MTKISKVISTLASEVEAAGSQRAWAKRHGFTPGYVSHVLCGRKQPSSKMLAALGFRKVQETRVSYQREVARTADMPDDMVGALDQQIAELKSRL